MPTKKKRVGFIPREDVMKIIDKLSMENNISNSKIISILVEEALSIRGMFNNKTGKATPSYQQINDYSQNFSGDIASFKNSKKHTINTKSRNDKYYYESNLLNRNDENTFDLQTYKKFLLFLQFQEMIDEFNGF